MDAYVLLDDGTKFRGKLVSGKGKRICHMVFNTMTAGYHEVITDCAYIGQAVCMTYPIIGSYGLNTVDMCGQQSFLSALIVRQINNTPSNFRCDMNLRDYLEKNDIFCVEEIDTRSLTRHLRDNGTQNAVIFSEDYNVTDEDLQQMRDFKITGSLDCVKKYVASQTLLPKSTIKHKLALINYGQCYDLCSIFLDRGCSIDVFNADISFDVLKNYDGVVLSNGPEDYTIDKKFSIPIKKLMGKGIPMLGVGIGHIIMAHACQLDLFRLKHGHRGINQPVRHIKSGRIYSTCQTRSLAIKNQDIPESMRITHINVNDGTIEGIKYADTAFSVSFYSKDAPSPIGSEYLYKEFLDMLTNKEEK